MPAKSLAGRTSAEGGRGRTEEKEGGEGHLFKVCGFIHLAGALEMEKLEL